MAMVVVGCSTQKNTANARRWHAFTARYNTFYNGHEAYKDGLLEQERANKDNYMDILPYFPISNKKTVGSGNGNFDRAIEKSQKAIKQHSIKKKPKRKAGEKKTEKTIRWYAKKEYNPFIHHAWFLMAKAQFQKGEFLEAASTFSYISRLYVNEPDKVAEARLWMARCYTELEWYYDAEDVLNKAARDSMPTQLEGDRMATYTNFLLRQGRFEEALPYLESSVKTEKKGVQRARHYFLLGQVYQHLGNTALAYQAFSKVIKSNPPYEMEFNARIKQTEVASDKESSRAIKRLETMARSPKNKEYLDQVYYAIGNMYMAKHDTFTAIKNYEEGVEKSTRGGVEKGVLLLRLGNLYWERAKYADAQRCYAEVIGLLEDKESEEYKSVSRRSEVLDELVEHAQSVELQDSLQRLAAMSEEERLVIINQIIERVKEEEEKAKKEAEQAKRMAAREAALSNIPNRNAPSRTPTSNMSGDRSWYFYNQQLITQGKGTVLFSNNSFPLKRGGLVFGFKCEHFAVKPQENLEYMYIHFEGSRAEELFRRFGISNQNRLFGGFDGIIPLWQDTLAGANENTIDLASESVLLYTFARLFKSITPRDTLISKILKISEENFTDPALSLTYIADTLGYNSKYISHLFKKALNVTYSEHLRNLRIQYAIEWRNVC